MGALITKEELLESLAKLPDRFTIDEAIERMLLLEAIEEGRQQGRRGEFVEDEDLHKHLPKWLG